MEFVQIALYSLLLSELPMFSSISFSFGYVEINTTELRLK